ncbi:MAG TPA: GNAT family N-acetyltransferase [Ktedonobacteraceae bacterium]|nr:GNAT family N-acetyltransferase [Ktedonobacteraceae bacterium]
MAYTEIRLARPEDRDAVLAFCAHTWEWGDYIEYVWDEWLHDPHGQMFVATVDGQPVGVAHFRMLSATEAWLEGMRIDPSYRQQGLATAINNTMLAEAMKRGATVARLITESKNTAAIRAMGHSFMRQVGAFVPFKAMPVTTAPKSEYGVEKPQLATSADIDEVIKYLNASNIFPAVGGLYNLGFTAYTITNDLLEAKVQAKHVYLLRRWDRLDGLAIAEPEQGRQDKYLFIGYIDGTTEAISLIAYALRRMVLDMGLESVRADAPDLMMVRDAFVGAEYEWDGKVFYTYERRLT